MWLPLARCLRVVVGLTVFGVGFVACVGEEPLVSSEASVLDASTVDAGVVPVGLPGQLLALDFEHGTDLYVDLRTPEVWTLPSPLDVEPAREGKGWDLRFDGWRLLTNGGPSGPGDGGAFGPAEELDYLFETIPQVPVRPDYTGGAVSSWYRPRNQTVRSLFHVYGVRVGAVHYKLQILSYYTRQRELLEPAFYLLRYARVNAEGGDGSVVVLEVDARGSGNGVATNPSSACVNLERGDVRQLTLDEAQRDKDWHLCFNQILVRANGGLSGPGSVGAVDLHSDLGGSLLGAEEEAVDALFDSVDYAALTAAGLRYDQDYLHRGVVETSWVGGNPGEDASLLPATWILRAADGRSHFALRFEQLEDASRSGPGKVKLRFRELRSPSATPAGGRPPTLP